MDLENFQAEVKKLPGSGYKVGLAIMAAGKTNDAFWVPYLTPFLKYARNRNSNLTELADAAQVALAKLGETKQLQEIACEAEYGNASLQSTAVRKLQYVNGWFSLNLFRRWLEEPRRAATLLKEPPGDVIYPDRLAYSLTGLRGLVPDPPVDAPAPLWLQTRNEEKLGPYRQAWREWFEKHYDSVMKLPPIGEGIDFSTTTCKPVLAHDRHRERY